MNTDKKEYKAVAELEGLYKSNRDIYREGSPSVMNDARDKAMAMFVEKGIPTHKCEDYKYSDFRAVFEQDFSVVPRYVKHEIDLHDIFNCDVPKLESHIILLINGWYYARNRKVGNLPEGVICGSLLEILNESPELANKLYNTLASQSNDPFAALNTALAKDGLLLYVPDNVVVEKPIQIINLLKNNENTFTTERNLFILGKNSEAKVLFCDHTLNGNEYLCNNVIECFAGKNANFHFCNIQNQHAQTTNITSMYIWQEAGSHVWSNYITLNGGNIRNNTTVLLSQENAEIHLNGITLLDGKQHADNFTEVEHLASNCQSNQLFKNVLDEESTGAFTGSIHVHRDAQKTEAYQKNNNVLMSEKAQMFTKPQLIIDADDVKCSHGATIGRIDEDSLFYLRARGIDEKEARLMLMSAFADEVVAQISVEALRDRIKDLVDRRLRGELDPYRNCGGHCGR